MKLKAPSRRETYYSRLLAGRSCGVVVIVLFMSAFGGAATAASAQTASSAQTRQVQEIYVQASEGSFNNQAVDRLLKQRGELAQLHFSGSPLQTFEQAEAQHAMAFTALENSTIAGRLVKASLLALQDYEVVSVEAAIRIPIEMCLLRSKVAIDSDQPLLAIASHPAALGQINRWKAAKHLQEIAVAAGTAAAAGQLASGQLAPTTGVVGPCMLPELYPALLVTEQGIQDNDNNQTLFGLMIVNKRPAAISAEQSRKALTAVVRMAEQYLQAH